MTALRNFAFEEHLVRVVDRDGDPWFVGGDVCRCLDLSNPWDALSKLDLDERCAVDRNTLGIGEGMHRGNPNIVIISEPGVYRLVFRSRKPEAERFKRWLAHEVIPAIRRTGRYDAAPAGAEAFDPDGSPVAAMRARVDLVREARLLFGPHRAAALWRRVGLPDMPEPPATLVGSASAEEGIACLEALMEFRPEAGATVRTLVARAVDGDQRAGRVLRESGVRVEPALFDELGIVVANRARFLATAFARTPWSGHRWGRALRGLPRWRDPGVMRFDKASHGTFVPLSALPS